MRHRYAYQLFLDKLFQPVDRKLEIVGYININWELMEQYPAKARTRKLLLDPLRQLSFVIEFCLLDRFQF